MADEIPRFVDLPVDVLERDFLAAGRPVVLTGVLERWKAGKRWSLDFFRANYGERMVFVRGGDRQTWKRLGRLSLADYVDYLTGGAPSPVLEPHLEHHPYAAFTHLAGVEPDIDFVGAVPANYTFTRPMLWIGPAGSLTPLHRDESGISGFAQFAGRKHFTLYPEEQSRFLYPSDVFDFMSVFSSVNLDAPDLTRHPLFARARSVELVLEPGEILFIPNRMWHEVRALETSISLSVRMGPARRFSATQTLWNLKALLHLVGVYKRGRCLCHIVDLHASDVAQLSPGWRLLVERLAMRGHGRDLADLLGWRA